MGTDPPRGSADQSIQGYTINGAKQPGIKVHAYYFTVESPDPVMKSGHAIELSTVFKHPELNGDMGRVFDETFSKYIRTECRSG